MSTDRELLELAAKAAGVSGPYFDGPNPIHVGIWDGFRYWNPLTDYGDALRLAVKLGEKFPCFMLGIYNRAAFPHVSTSVVYLDGTETYIEQDADADVGAATRRAIVRAAAELGRQS